MSLFEWMAESHNPGPQGSLGLEGASRRPPRGDVVPRFVFALAILGAAGFFLFVTGLAVAYPALTLGLVAAYLVISYFARPEPDTSNLGWFGGWMDNPFRFSDDVNRTLLFLKIVLLPGRFVSESVVDFVCLFRSR